MAKEFHIVLDKEDSRLSKMEKTDFRFEGRVNIGKIVSSKKGFSQFNGRQCAIVKIDSGEKFEVFSDWSARKR